MLLDNPHEIASRKLDAKRAAITARVIDIDYARRPELLARYGEKGRDFYIRDNDYHISYLSEALSTSQPELFADYIEWAKTMLIGYGVLPEDLIHNMQVLCEAITEVLDDESATIATGYVEVALERLPSLPRMPAAFIRAGEPHFELAERYLQLLLAGDRHDAAKLIVGAVQGGAPVREIYLHIFQKVQYEIGRLWQTNQISVAQEHYCTAATQVIMAQLYPYIFTTKRRGRTMVATCITGDLHEMGIRMVSDFFELDGWDTYYLGANTPIQSIIKTLAERRADMLAISATMTSHVRVVRELIEQVRAAELPRQVKILVGGYPFKLANDLWKKIGADSCASDAEAAVEAANKLFAKTT